MLVRIVINAKLIGPWCPVCISARVLWTSDFIMNHKVRRHLLTHDAWSPPPVPGGRMSGRLMMPGCDPCHVNTNTFINFLGCFLMSEHVSVSRNQGRVMHPIGPGNTRSKERKWGANRKYPDYRNKWENILCADLSCVVCDPLRWWQALSWMSWGCVIRKIKILRAHRQFLGNTQQVFEGSSSWAKKTSSLSQCAIKLSDKAI